MNDRFATTVARPRMLIMSNAIEAMVKPSPEEFDIVRLDDGGADRDAFLREVGAGLEVVLCSGGERLDAARLDLLPDLKLIAVVAAGMAGIDLDHAARRGIAVTNAGGLNSGDVAEFAVTMMLAHRRDIVAADRWVRDDEWVERRMPVGRSVSGERVGVVGLGHIGDGIARRIAPFVSEVRWWGPRAKPEIPWAREGSILDLARWSTTLFIAARGDDSSRGLVTAEIIDALGPEGLIVNVARGFVIDEPAMIAALKTGRLGGAALDVFEEEPARAADWADVPNLLMAPHVAGATREAFARVFANALDNIRRHFAGQPLVNRVI
ncbi:MAG: 2-hydroxyacid dehydrogenase [Sphingobium sp.]